MRVSIQLSVAETVLIVFYTKSTFFFYNLKNRFHSKPIASFNTSINMENIRNDSWNRLKSVKISGNVSVFRPKSHLKYEGTKE